LTIDYESNDRPFKEVEEICKDYPSKEIDMRPYMLEEVYTVSSRDIMTKIVNLFRIMHLRHLPVLNDKTGKVEGIITR
jgi:CBS domain-containing protein